MLMDQNDQQPPNCTIINFLLKGGPPWGFRIKQRATKVIVSKVNCGGRASKTGLQVNDEICAVNNLEIDNHPLTFAFDDGTTKPGEELPRISKLDFTYQLIRHTINRQLYLTIRRFTEGEPGQPCCYYLDDDTVNDVWQFPEIHSQSEEEILSPSEEQQEINSDRRRDNYVIPFWKGSKVGSFVAGLGAGLTGGTSSSGGGGGQASSSLSQPDLQPLIPRQDLKQPFANSTQQQVFAQFHPNIQLQQQQQHHQQHHHQLLHQQQLQHPPPQLQQQQQTVVTLHHQQPAPVNQIHTLNPQQVYHSTFHHPTHHQQQGQHHLDPSSTHLLSSSASQVQQQQQHHQQQLRQLSLGDRFFSYGDLSPTDFALLLTSPSESESSMPVGVSAPKFKSRAPKNIWSPGSTTTTSSTESLPARHERKHHHSSHHHPVTTASATQTTPTRSESLPRGFRPVRLTTFQQPEQQPSVAAANNTSSDNTSNNVNNNNNNNNNSANNNNPNISSSNIDRHQQPPPHLGGPSTSSNLDQVLDPGPLSPSTISEISIETSDTTKQSQRVTPPSSPQLKYWTLPRNISIGSKNGSVAGEIVNKIETDQAPPPSAKFVYESPSTKYFTLPVKTSSSSEPRQRSASAHSVPKYPGIGPVTDNGIPLALRSGVRDEFASDWYRTMYKRLHQWDRPENRDENAIRIKVKSHKPREYRFDANYFSDDEASIPRPRHISDYVTGTSSITEREKQMFYADLINYIDTIFSDVFKNTFQDPSKSGQQHHHLRMKKDENIGGGSGEKSSTGSIGNIKRSENIYANQSEEERSRINRELEMARRAQEDQERKRREDEEHKKSCVFTALTNNGPSAGLLGSDSDSSFVVRRKDERREPVSRSTYMAIQRGDSDIPFSGLQKPAPLPRGARREEEDFMEDYYCEYSEPVKFTSSKSSPSNARSLRRKKEENQEESSIDVPSIINMKGGASSGLGRKQNQNPSGFTPSSFPSNLNAGTQFGHPSSLAASRFDAAETAESDYYSEVTPEPPIRPAPPFSDKAIDDWYKKMNDDFNCIYHKMGTKQQQQQQQNSSPFGTESKSRIENNRKEFSGGGSCSSSSTKRMTRKESKKRMSNSNHHQHHHSHKHQPSSSSSTGQQQQPFAAPKVVISDWTEDNPLDPFEMSHYRDPPPIPGQGVGNGRKIKGGGDEEDYELLFAKGDGCGLMDGRESPHQFTEQEVNIHYRTPVTQLQRDPSSSFSLQTEAIRRQREQMRKYYGMDVGDPLSSSSREHSQSPSRGKHHFTPSTGVVHLDRYQKAFTEKDPAAFQHVMLARVLYDFHALSSRELSVKKGDIVIIERPINHNWVEVEDSQSGLKGLVPRNYLDYDQEGVARAKFDFEAQTPVELQLKKGETLKLLRKVDDNWFEGLNAKNEVGIFPCSYVQIIKPPIILPLNNNRYSISPSPGPRGSTARGRSTSPGRSGSSRSPSQRPQSTPLVKAKDANGANKSTLPSDPYRLNQEQPQQPKDGKLFRVMYPYKPRQTDELELVTGDILTVTMQCDDGWFVGQSTLTGNFGTFPGNYVAPLVS